jgi:hypothetical protein
MQTALIVQGGKRAVTNGIRRTVTLEKNALRRHVAASGLGAKLGNALRGRTFPEQGYSMNARGWIDSKAIYKRAGGFVDLFTVMQEGAWIQGSPYLAISLIADAKSPKDARRKPIPSDFPAGTFDIRPTLRPGVFVLYFKGTRVSTPVGGTHGERVRARRLDALGGNTGRPAFLLIRRVAIKGRLNLQSIHDQYSAGLDARVLREWEKEIERAGSRVAAS